jgi:hypothetical protein
MGSLNPISYFLNLGGMFKYKEHYDYKFIVTHLDQLEVWRDLLGYYCELEQPICNTLRYDNHPNCWLSYAFHKRGLIVMNDFADRKFHGMTVFDAVMHKHSLDFDGACSYIFDNYIASKNIEYKDDVLYNPKSPAPKPHFHVSFLPYSTFIPVDRKFWQPLEVAAKQLRSDGVYSVYKYRLSNKTRTGIREYLSTGPCYAYTFPSKHIKLYMPTEEKKFLTNADSYDIGMYDELPETGDVLFICKSYKDARIQKNLGFKNVIWIQGEHFKLPDEIIMDLYERFNTIYIYYDNDKSGRKGATLLAEECNTLTSSDKFKAIWLREDLLDYEYTHYFTNKPKVGINDNGDYLPIFGSKQLKEEINAII